MVNFRERETKDENSWSMIFDDYGVRGRIEVWLEHGKFVCLSSFGGSVVLESTNIESAKIEAVGYVRGKAQELYQGLDDLVFQLKEDNNRRVFEKALGPEKAARYNKLRGKG